ncbi:MAG: hypothetical protein AB1547_04455 [Thermodesulfobacteriota bacterium]
MSEESPLNSKDYGKNRDPNMTGKTELVKRTTLLMLLAILLFGVYLAKNSLIGAIENKFDIMAKSIAVVVNNSGNISRELEKNVEATTSAKNDILRALAKDAAPSGNSADVGAKQAAAGERALYLGKKELESGQIDKALLYFINGVNHDPGRIELVMNVAETALKSGSHELVERALGILELATMQVAPDDISVVLDRISALRAKIAPPPIPKMSLDDAEKYVQKLYEMYAPDTVWTDGAKVASGLSEIEFFQQIIDASRAPAKDDSYLGVMGKSAQLATSLQHIERNLPLYNHVMVCLAQMQAIVEADVPDVALFSSLSASSQGVLAQIWGGMAELPSEMQRKLQLLPSQMRAIEEKLQEKISAASYDQAVALLHKAEADVSGDFTARIKRITEALEKATYEADAITSGKLRLQLFKRIRETRNLLELIELNRRTAYQKWALKCVNGFMSDWNNNLHVSSDEAEKFFVRHEIAKIDENLIVPEVNRILNHVISCLIGKLNAKDGARIEYLMAATEKKRLENF